MDKMILNYFLYKLRDTLKYFKRIFGFEKRCERLDGDLIVITGANTDIGKETAYELSLKGAKIIISCRNKKKGETALNYIKEKNPKADIALVELNLSSLITFKHLKSLFKFYERT